MAIMTCFPSTPQALSGQGAASGSPCGPHVHPCARGDHLREGQRAGYGGAHGEPGGGGRPTDIGG